MLQADQVIRPDSIMRSGTIQPFSVRGESPVTDARNQIGPFIHAVRQTGADMVHMDGLGIHTVESRGLAAASFLENKWLQIGLAFVAGGIAGVVVARKFF